MKFPILNRKIHYWLSLFIALPAAVIFCSGILLQLKKQIHWVQPTEHRGEEGVPALTFDEILRICRTVPEARIRGWDDVNRIDVRVGRGILKVSAKSSWEIQIDSSSGQVLQAAYRRSDMIEAIHDGSWFHDIAKYGLFLPAGICLLLLWATGLYLFVLPYTVRWRRSRGSRAASIS